MGKGNVAMNESIEYRGGWYKIVEEKIHSIVTSEGGPEITIGLRRIARTFPFKTCRKVEEGQSMEVAGVRYEVTRVRVLDNRRSGGGIEYCVDAMEVW